MSNKYCNVLDMKIIEQKIGETIKRAKESNKEHGFNFCSKDGQIIATDIEDGGKDSLKIEDKCPKGSEIIGAFHVHTRSLKDDAIPSPTDITKGIVDEDITFFCIGASTSDHDIVRCFSKGDLEKEMKDIFTLLTKKDIVRSSKLISSRMTIKKDYLNKLSCQIEM